MAKIFDSTIGALNTSLNLRLMNQNIIASNIANADTPGYKAKRLDFESAFRDALDVGGDLKPLSPEPDHAGLGDTDAISPEIGNDVNYIRTLDENTVDRGKEMALQKQNRIMHSATTEMLKKKLGMLRYAINEGGSR